MFVINRGGCFYPLVNKYNIFYFFSEDLRKRISESHAGAGDFFEVCSQYWMWTRDAREWRHQSGVDAVGDGLEVFGGWREGRQRKVASVRAGTPSGDTTRTP